MKKIVPFLLCFLVFAVTALWPGVEFNADSIGKAISVETAATQIEQEPQEFTELSDTSLQETAKPVPTPAPTPEPMVIVKGDSSSEVTQLQEKLMQWGFTEDEPDGMFGNNTVEAVKRLQAYMNVVFENANLDWGDKVNGVDTVTADDISEDLTETLEYPITGEVYAKMRPYLFEDAELPMYMATVQLGDENDQVLRVQYRLESLGYLYQGADGQFGEKTRQGLNLFQETNGIEVTGIADKVTQEVLFSKQALAATRPVHLYKLVVDVSDQRVYVYMWNNGDYNQLINTFKCSTGLRDSPTPLGTYSVNTGPMERWHYFKKFNCWAQYAFRIEGDVLFHSVLYSKMDTKTLKHGSVYALGTRASHGCVRLSVSDAKWIFENCIAGTTVVVKN